MPKEPSHSFNIILSNPFFDTLSRLAKAREVTRAQYIRELIRNANIMAVQRQPLCADGRHCVAPHLHPIRQANTDPNAA